jgi:bifunctional DNA-binding transcriptional regulator/antitoxin component of YhaV-PrlF toxin-antitoxin module
MNRVIPPETVCRRCEIESGYRGEVKASNSDSFQYKLSLPMFAGYRGENESVCDTTRDFKMSPCLVLTCLAFLSTMGAKLDFPTVLLALASGGDKVPLVRIKTKFQVTLPNDVRKRAGVRVGDFLEAKVERGKITLTPKTVIDRGVAESLEEFRKGRSYGPFDAAEEMLDSLDRNVKKLRANKSKSPRR